ncbi:MAG: hypothetical protein D8M50_06100 [Candidatus Brocadia sp. AMX1]|nr:hypothetical protein [Candidatus Brocadia sp. AMX1]
MLISYFIFLNAIKCFFTFKKFILPDLYKCKIYHVIFQNPVQNVLRKNKHEYLGRETMNLFYK